MTTPTYAVPDNPVDPEAAALELIVRLPRDLLGHDWPTLDALQEFTALLSVESCFAGLSWHDSKHAAVAIIADAVNRDDAAAFLCQRAARARDGSDGMRWDDSAAIAKALEIGAKVVAL